LVALALELAVELEMELAVELELVVETPYLLHAFASELLANSPKHKCF
jgi:hypothetical protein